MKQFGKILKFELKYYLTNKIFIGVTAFLMVLIAVVMFIPRIGMLFTAEEESGVEKSDIFKGQSIVISGVFTHHSRDEYKAMIEAHGGKNVGSVSKKTSFILAGENMGPEKRKKAEMLGVEIFTEEQFLALLQHS